MRRTAIKAGRDLLWIAVGSALLAVGQRAADFGVPAEFTPLVAAASLALYRMGRQAFQGDPAR